MAVIVRTAGMERPKPEIKRDYEYLLRLWDEIRELTLKSSAPALIHEEGNLVKRAIRDLYQRDIDEVLVEGEDGYRTAKSFMKMIVPSHAKRVQPYRDPAIPLFHRFQVESQLDAIHSPTVQLRSGGYIVINPTEALVSIDVNSGRATRERHIEETALKTNLEAAEEVARQVRLRDLAGLIVIDFIDMEENRNNHAVERRVKEAMKNDRARIQIGKISPFGLLELSRQRLRPSLIEASSMRCPHCGGTGTVRSIESTALHVLRAIEEEGIRGKSAEIRVEVPSQVALYILNQKRDALIDTEARYHLKIEIGSDDSLVPPAYKLERLRQRQPGEEGAPVALPLPRAAAEEDDEDSVAGETESETETESEEVKERVAEESDGEGGKRRRRRGRRRRRRGDEAGDQPSLDHEETAATALAEGEAGEQAQGEPQESNGEQRDDDGARRRRRRGKRGGRRHGRGPEGQRDGRENGEAFAGEAPLNAPSALIDSFADHDAPVAGEARRADEPAPSWRRPSEESDTPVSGETAAREPAAPPRRPSFLDKLDPPQRYVPAGWLSPVRSSESAEAAPQSESVPAPVSAPAPHAAAPPDQAVLPAAAATIARQQEQEQEQEEEPNPAIQVTVVATPPEKPRRGWWGKLGGKD
jgi:ribonuclease E